jgi:hypothetical protein
LRYGAIPDIDVALDEISSVPRQAIVRAAPVPTVLLPNRLLAMACCEPMAFTNSAMACSGRWRAMSASLTIPTSRWLSLTGSPFNDGEHLFDAGSGSTWYALPTRVRERHRETRGHQFTEAGALSAGVLGVCRQTKR